MEVLIIAGIIEFINWKLELSADTMRIIEKIEESLRNSPPELSSSYRIFMKYSRAKLSSFRTYLSKYSKYKRQGYMRLQFKNNQNYIDKRFEKLKNKGKHSYFLGEFSKDSNVNICKYYNHLVKNKDKLAGILNAGISNMFESLQTVINKINSNSTLKSFFINSGYNIDNDIQIMNGCLNQNDGNSYTQQPRQQPQQQLQQQLQQQQFQQQPRQQPQQQLQQQLQQQQFQQQPRQQPQQQLQLQQQPRQQPQQQQFQKQPQQQLQRQQQQFQQQHRQQPRWPPQQQFQQQQFPQNSRNLTGGKKQIQAKTKKQIQAKTKKQIQAKKKKQIQAKTKKQIQAKTKKQLTKYPRQKSNIHDKDIGKTATNNKSNTKKIVISSRMKKPKHF